MRTRNRASIKKAVSGVEKSSDKNYQNNNYFDNIPQIRFFHSGGILPSGPRKSTRYINNMLFLLSCQLKQILLIFVAAQPASKNAKFVIYSVTHKAPVSILKRLFDQFLEVRLTCKPLPRIIALINSKTNLNIFADIWIAEFKIHILRFFQSRRE